MTLREQIKQIHKATFTPEFTEMRGYNIPAMVQDLKLHYFDTMKLNVFQDTLHKWFLPDSIEVRAVKRASELIATMSLRRDIPAVE